MVILKTSLGDIKIELNPEKAPTTCANFENYVRSGFYDGTIFHRVISGFMIQGGGFTQKMEQKSTSAPIKNEADNGLKNEEGTIAMARTPDPHSATAQFFINTVNNSGNGNFFFSFFCSKASVTNIAIIANTTRMNGAFWIYSATANVPCRKHSAIVSITSIQ